MAPITKLTTLAFAAIAAASSSAGATVSEAPCKSSEFTLSMKGFKSEWLSLGAVDSKTEGMIHVVGFNPETYIGTPVKQTGGSNNAMLSFDIQPGDDCETAQTGVFGLFVMDLGERYGSQVGVTGSKGKLGSPFIVGGGSIYPHRTAASQGWYACSTTFQGEEYTGLSWGVYNSNGSSPYGCAPTSVRYQYNIPCDG